VGTGATTQQTIGAAGGTISLEMFTLTIPAGALAADTVITLRSLPTAAPAPFFQTSPFYQMTPAGLTFNAPVTATFTFLGTPPSSDIYWSLPSSTQLEARTTTTNGNSLSTTNTHFSGAGTGQCRAEITPCECPPLP
jgi:hypothetical protein